MRLISRTNILLALISLLLLLPNFINYHFVQLSKTGHPWEQFDPSLTNRLKSVNDILHYTDSIAAIAKADPKSINYGILLNRVIKKRFYHGYSYYSLSDNWVAAVAGRFVWDDLSAIVLPDDILKYPMAACSQQCIVLIECFKRKNIAFRKVGFNNHFAVEGEFHNHWYYFDPDMEPDFGNFPRVGIDSIIRLDGLPIIYRLSLNAQRLKTELGNYRVGKPNKAVAPNGSIFQRATKVLAKAAWLLPLGFILVSLKKARKEQQNSVVTNAELEVESAA